jgi:hypothetical protein
MAFKFSCPKCQGNDFNIVRDNRTFTPTRAFELIFSCRCGKQLFGDHIEQEYERQKRAYEVEAVDREREERDRVERESAEEERQSAMRKAILYQQRYQEEQRLKVEAEEAARKAELDRRWREKVAALRSDDPNAVVPAPPAALPPAALPPVIMPPVSPKPRAKVRKAPPSPAAPAAPAATEAGDGSDEEYPEGHPLRCAWDGCAKRRRKNSKYCSRNCSNKNARARHKKRSGKKDGDAAA